MEKIEFEFKMDPTLKLQWNESPEAATLMVGLGEEVKARAKELAPVRTGKLKNSIRAKFVKLKTAPAAEVSANTRYAGFVEFGTSRMAAEPYLRPALDEVVGAKSSGIFFL